MGSRIEQRSRVESLADKAGQRARNRVWSQSKQIIKKMETQVQAGMTSKEQNLQKCKVERLEVLTNW